MLRNVAGMAETLSEEVDARVSTRGRPAPGLVLVHSEGTPRLRAALLPPAGLEIGRGTFAGMPLDDQRLSSRHVRVAWSGGAWSIADLESHNGTYVDGRRVTGEATFERARVLRAGRTIFLLENDVRRFVGASIERDGDALVGPTLLGPWREIERAARSGDVLLLTGESGAGKDLASRAFHARAGARGPFVAVNCAAIPQGLAERLLFGTRRGAYSGATEDADGYVQAADGGTLFLDEVADLDTAVQPKLLRAIEAKEIVPLGASRPRRVEVRVCSAARDLRRAVAEGRFREDLYFRIGRPEVSIPPLRERCEEIPWLLASELGRARSGLTAAPALVEACILRPWPGNVRELLSETRRMAGAVGDRDTVGLEDLARDAGAELPRAAARPSAARDLPDDATIEKTLRDHGGNVTRAARTLGMHRNQVRRWIAKRRAPEDGSE
jgi:transcriptional regulator with PAS, ATPase and Fis domain